MTDDDNHVDADDAGLWRSVSDVARGRGVSKQAIAKRVDRGVAQGALFVRTGPRGTKLINVVEFDRFIGETTDLVRATNGTRRSSEQTTSGLEGPVLAREQALRARYDAELKRLDLELRQGRLVDTSAVSEGYDRAGSVIRQVVECIEERADDLASVVARDGVRGMQLALKRLGTDLLREIADALAAEAAHLRVQDNLGNAPDEKQT